MYVWPCRSAATLAVYAPPWAPNTQRCENYRLTLAAKVTARTAAPPLSILWKLSILSPPPVLNLVLVLVLYGGES
jgi:hypothetical protein